MSVKHRGGEKKPKRDAWQDALRHMAAGGIANGVAEFALFPLDTIKTRLQAANGAGGLVSVFGVGVRGGGGFLAGVSGLYTGVLPNVAGQIPSASLFFAVYEPVKAAVAAALPPGYSSLVQVTVFEVLNLKCVPAPTLLSAPLQVGGCSPPISRHYTFSPLSR